MTELLPGNSLACALREGANDSFRYHRNDAFVEYVVNRIETILNEFPEPSARDVVYELVRVIDYRFVASYLRALRTNDDGVIKLFERIVAATNPTERNKLLYQLAHFRFSRSTGSDVNGEMTVVSNIDDLFSNSKPGLIIYLKHSAMQPELMTLLRDVRAQLGSFIEQQLDLPGINARVRQGVVKSWVLAGGAEVVSKTQNPSKPGRFHIEQLNYEAIAKILSRSEEPLRLGPSAGGGSVTVALAQPFALIRDNYAGCYYALAVRANGISLQNLLLSEREGAVRRQHLTYYRWLLDSFFNRGILWGDMSPRNIIVETHGANVLYHIFDFEKTKILNRPLTVAERIEHCRGQVGVEELGVICTLAELENCFRGYFTPAEWDQRSEEPLPFVKRPEVDALLEGRGLVDVKLGAYNRADMEIISVRSPDVDPATGQRRFPSDINFKVEHYLSCAGYDTSIDYERKTTEILIAGKRHDYFETVVQVLTRVIDRVENAFLTAEFEALLNAPSPYCLIPPTRDVVALTQTLESLYQLCQSGKDFRELCDYFAKDTVAQEC